MTFNDIATLFGIIFGVSGFSLAVLNYLRDRPKVKVSVRWDMSVVPNAQLDSNKEWGLISVSNVGRRPIYVSHVALRLPRGNSPSHLVLVQGITGARLAEGDPPLTYPVDQERMAKYGEKWYKIRAQVSDSAGKTWLSKPIDRKNKPSWVRS